MNTMNRPARVVAGDTRRPLPQPPFWHTNAYWPETGVPISALPTGRQGRTISASPCFLNGLSPTPRQPSPFPFSKSGDGLTSFSGRAASPMPVHSELRNVFGGLAVDDVDAATNPPPPKFFNPVAAGPECHSPEGRVSPGWFSSLDGPNEFEVVPGTTEILDSRGMVAELPDEATVARIGSADPSDWAELSAMSLDDPIEYSEPTSTATTPSSTCGTPLSPVAEFILAPLGSPRLVDEPPANSPHFFGGQFDPCPPTPPLVRSTIDSRRVLSAPLPKFVSDLASVARRASASPRLSPSHAPARRSPSVGSPAFGRRPPSRASPSMGRKTSEMPMVVRHFIAQLTGEYGHDQASTEALDELLKEMPALQVNKYIESLGVAQVDATTIKQYRRRLKNRVYTRVARSKARKLKKSNSDEY